MKLLIAAAFFFLPFTAFAHDADLPGYGKPWLIYPPIEQGEPPVAQPEPEPPVAQPEPPYDAIIEPGSDVGAWMKSVFDAGARDSTRILLKAGTHKRIAFGGRRTTAIGAVTLDGEWGVEADTVLDCTLNENWIQAKGCIASEGTKVTSLKARNLIFDATIMDGTNSRGIFVTWPLVLEDSIFRGCEESCLQGQAGYDWTLRRVRMPIGKNLDGSLDFSQCATQKTPPIGHGVYSAPGGPDALATMLIEDSDLCARNKHVVKSNHARTIIRNSRLTGGDGDTGHVIAFDARQHATLDNVVIHRPLDRTNDTWMIMGTPTAGRCERYGDLIVPKLEMKDVSIVDDTIKEGEKPARIVFLGCAKDVPLIDMGGNTLNGVPINQADLNSMARRN